jgi:uncharacterized membrane protein
MHLDEKLLLRKFLWTRLFGVLHEYSSSNRLYPTGCLRSFIITNFTLCLCTHTRLLYNSSAAQVTFFCEWWTGRNENTNIRGLFKIAYSIFGAVFAEYRKSPVSFTSVRLMTPWNSVLTTKQISDKLVMTGKVEVKVVLCSCKYHAKKTYPMLN